MKGRTARSVQRLKHSPDFDVLLTYFNEERDRLVKSLIRAGTERDTTVLQGKLLFLENLLLEINDSDKIAKLPQ